MPGVRGRNTTDAQPYRRELCRAASAARQSQLRTLSSPSRSAMSTCSPLWERGPGGEGYKKRRYAHEPLWEGGPALCQRGTNATYAQPSWESGRGRDGPHPRHCSQRRSVPTPPTLSPCGRGGRGVRGRKRDADPQPLVRDGSLCGERRPPSPNPALKLSSPSRSAQCLRDLRAAPCGRGGRGVRGRNATDPQPLSRDGPVAASPPANPNVRPS